MGRKRYSTPNEKIVRTDFILLAFNRLFEKGGPGLDRIVDLACGHKTRTRSFRGAHCPRCEEMLRRSIEDGSEDYVSYRAGLIRDRMVWIDDPLRQFHEQEFEQQFIGAEQVTDQK